MKPTAMHDSSRAGASAARREPTFFHATMFHALKESTMKPATRLAIKPLAALLAATCALSAQAQFNSGSTGADGAFSPTVNTEVVLPPSGIFNYTTVNIPAGVTVTFRRNTLNTPVVILVQGDATIAGVINVNGQAGRPVGSAGDGNQGDDGQPGEGGPGGFSGGRGGSTNRPSTGGAGLGPGGGFGGERCAANASNPDRGQPGAGAGHNGGGASGAPNVCSPQAIRIATGGSSYGSTLALPLIGGSGGGGGSGNLNSEGAGGGGGGGAILIAVSGTLTVTGSVLANGALGGNAAGPTVGFLGGSGSGGAIRLVATALAGNGTISAIGGAGQFDPQLGIGTSGAGAAGRIRIEGLTITRTAASNPADTRDTPGPLFIPNSPSIRIAAVAGTAVPANPTGNADVTLPTTTTNPVTVDFTSSNVPLGNTIRLTVTPANGDPTSAVSTAIAGTLAAGTATVSVTLPPGPSILQAQTTFTVVAALGDALRNFAANERVERLEVTASLGGAAGGVQLVTVSGKRFDAPAAALALIDTFNAMQSALARAGS